jgi:hypothetical protein
MIRFKVYRDGNPSCFGDFGCEEAAKAQAEKFNTPDMLANASGTGPFRVVRFGSGSWNNAAGPDRIDGDRMNYAHRVSQREG